MRITNLRKADLNLLVVFTALAEERNVTRAARRLRLSQPAVSRALGRLRDMFRDDLLVRTSNGYEPTPLGNRLVQELAVMLPQLDRLISGSEFDPASESATVRIALTDNAAHVVGPPVCHSVLPFAETISLEFVAWHDGTFEELERGRLDLALNADDGNNPERFRREVIYTDEFVCVVARASAYSRRLTLKQYVAGLHVGVGVLGGRQTIPEQRLSALGHTRTCAVEVPYFAAAMRCVEGTNLIATIPKRLAEAEAHNRAVKILGAPAEMTGFKYLMLWHPRLDTDAAHNWLRSVVREAGRSVSATSA